MAPKVAVILVNYNGYEDTTECVQSLLGITYQNYTIFVVDNASTEENKIQDNPLLQRNTRMLQSDANLGFSGGNNLAIQVAMKEGFDYILLLNNDTIAEPDFLTEMVSTAESDRNIGIVAGKIYFYHDKQKIWAAGGEYSRRTGVTIQYGGEEKEALNQLRDLTFATGCLMLIPRHVVEKVGLLEEKFFLYSEDTDYCQRVLDAGYRIRYTPTAKIYHKISASIGDASAVQQRYMMRNNLYMIQKYCNRKVVAYLGIMIQTIKDIIRKRKNVVPTMHGVWDYVRRRDGKI